MKQLLLLCLFLIVVPIRLHSQDFDGQLEELAQNIATKLDGKDKKKIAVWGFVTESGERTALGNYITEDFSVYLTNFGVNYEIIDRNHLDMLLKEHQLNSEGYIDEATAKELGKIVAVDAIITGTYTVLTTSVKVRAKVLDTETALQFAANMATLPLNENVSSYLGISVNGGNTTNKGFNTPLNSNETVNNPDTVDAECKEKNIGDFCFYNSSISKVILAVEYKSPKGGGYGSIRKSLTIVPNETKCLYQLPNFILNYYIATWDIFEKDLEGNEAKLYSTRYSPLLKEKGELKVETCKSKTYTIK